MSDTVVEEGIYALASFYDPEVVIEAQGGKAAVSQFVGSERQQWELAKMYGAAWSIRNVATQQYLGIKPGDAVEEYYDLCGVEDVFPWHVQKGHLTSIFVPYTPYLVAHNLEFEELGTSVNLQQSRGYANQRWFLCKDLHLAASIVIQNGFIYHIINDQTQTAIEVNDSGVACFKADKEDSKQKFMAIKTETGWAFQNVATKRFLGLPISVLPIPDSIHLSAVSHECIWVVLPHHEDTARFRLWIQFTARVMNLC
ncbi:hypothetical protein BKA70DRAFT_1320328 [Coprinopsis sp. MPI-PUGE-AT-0042]|nr:hypothetical protein BKA70DRAFT_1320328 [Coprinopsis sp. MPI-PUGE-AT-0042]